MTSIRKTKKALKREIRRLESEMDYSVFRANDATLQEFASTWTNAWLVAFKESEFGFFDCAMPRKVISCKEDD